jgi:RNA polymerase sigma factor (sigma-70 family)
MHEPRDVSGDLLRANAFPPTHWSVVLAAAQQSAPGSERALARLCEAYWFPLYAFLRRQGHPREEAEDLTQEFFALLLRKEVLAGLEREGGRFRSFLLTALQRFLANEWNRDHAQKRGGYSPQISIDGTAEARYHAGLADRATPETLFEQQWALAILDRVLAKLQREYASLGKAELFNHLQGCLPGSQDDLSYAEAGAALHLNESAVRMAALRLRRRYGQLLRAEIAPTVASPKEIDDELRHLMNVMGGS